MTSPDKIFHKPYNLLLLMLTSITAHFLVRFQVLSLVNWQLDKAIIHTTYFETSFNTSIILITYYVSSNKTSKSCAFKKVTTSSFPEGCDSSNPSVDDVVPRLAYRKRGTSSIGVILTYFYKDRTFLV